MPKKNISGLLKRKGVWHIDKVIYGIRICKSCGTSSISEAEVLLSKLTEQTRQACLFGTRPQRTFREASTKFIDENQHKKSIRNDESRIGLLLPWIGDMPIDSLHMETLRPWVQKRQHEGAAAGTINHGLKVVRRILNLASTEWHDQHGLTWLLYAPKIKLLPDNDKRQPYPMNWEEQDKLFNELPEHLRQMALFGVNTGCRDQEICNLRWEWEIKVPELDTSVFLIPLGIVKNKEDRLVVLNDTAMKVIEEQRGQHDEFVFTYKGEPTKRILNSAWMRARKDANLVQVRVHDLKHTFGRRLRATGVSFEDRQDLLGHKSGRITTHYSAAELTNLIKAANSVNRENLESKPIVILRRNLK